MLYRRAQDLHSLSAMATGQFICGCDSIIMAIKLLEYMGDTVGLSSLQIIISQKADNWGSIGSVKTVIGEMGHWGTAVGTALWRRENGKGSRSLTYTDRGAVIWWTEDAIPVQLMGRQSEAFLLHSWESWQKYISQMACGDDIITHMWRWWIGHHNLRLKVSGRNYASCFKWTDGCPGFLSCFIMDSDGRSGRLNACRHRAWRTEMVTILIFFNIRHIIL